MGTDTKPSLGDEPRQALPRLLPEAAVRGFGGCVSRLTDPSSPLDTMSP
jgi:hypothetical protein